MILKDLYDSENVDKCQHSSKNMRYSLYVDGCSEDEPD